MNDREQKLNNILSNLLKSGVSKQTATSLFHDLAKWIEDEPSESDWIYGGTDVGSICSPENSSSLLGRIRRQMDEVADDLTLLNA